MTWVNECYGDFSPVTFESPYNHPARRPEAVNRMDFRQSLFSLFNITVAVLAAYLLFRKTPRQALLARGPLFILFLLFFSAGLANLPLALPRLFERLLGHSVWANYAPPPKINVTQIGGTWWLVRWQEPIQTGYFCLFIVGMVWAVINIVQHRQLKVNAVSLCLGGILVLVSIVYSFVCFPFCF